MNFGTPREVGYPPRILSARKNLRLVLTDRQVNILVGSLLGDGYIEQKGKIQLEHSDQQVEYLHWKYAELKNLAYRNPPKAVQRYDKRKWKNIPLVPILVTTVLSTMAEYILLGKIKSFSAAAYAHAVEYRNMVYG